MKKIFSVFLLIIIVLTASCSVEESDDESDNISGEASGTETKTLPTNKETTKTTNEEPKEEDIKSAPPTTKPINLPVEEPVALPVEAANNPFDLSNCVTAAEITPLLGTKHLLTIPSTDRRTYESMPANDPDEPELFLAYLEFPSSAPSPNNQGCIQFPVFHAVHGSGGLTKNDDSANDLYQEYNVLPTDLPNHREFLDDERDNGEYRLESDYRHWREFALREGDYSNDNRLEPMIFFAVDRFGSRRDPGNNNEFLEDCGSKDMGDVWYPHCNGASRAARDIRSGNIYLQGLAFVDATKIGTLGHSQGGAVKAENVKRELISDDEWEIDDVDMLGPLDTLNPPPAWVVAVSPLASFHGYWNSVYSYEMRAGDYAHNAPTLEFCCAGDSVCYKEKEECEDGDCKTVNKANGLQRKAEASWVGQGSMPEYRVEIIDTRQSHGEACDHGFFHSDGEENEFAKEFAVEEITEFIAEQI
jgi:hypothetical protein